MIPYYAIRRLGSCTKSPNNVSVLWWHGRPKDSGVGSQSIALRRAQGKEDGLLVGVGLALEPNYLVNGQSLRIEGLASDQVVKASSFGH